MGDCILCKVDGAATDEQTYRALYYVIGQNAEGPPLCDDHVRAQAFALTTLAALTGYGEWAGKIEAALRAPVLRLVPTPPEGHAEEP